MKNSVLLLTFFSAVFLLPISSVSASPEPHGNRAVLILKTMSDYITQQKTVELSFDSGIEIITPELEKIQFTSSGKAHLSRPDKLQAHRMSGHAHVSLFFDGKSVSIYEKQSHGYVQYDAPGTVDQLVEALGQGQGVALPGADLLLTNVYDVLMADVLESKYIGQGIVDGRACDHLAFRNFDTDWQLWVEAGDNPVPCKMVITSKTMNSAPQYTLLIKRWKSGISVGDDSFTFTPSADAQELTLDALIGFDELPPETTQGGTQ